MRERRGVSVIGKSESTIRSWCSKLFAPLSAGPVKPSAESVEVPELPTESETETRMTTDERDWEDVRDLIEECQRLRSDNERLLKLVARLGSDREKLIIMHNQLAAALLTHQVGSPN